jgi:hypothetical protein
LSEIAFALKHGVPVVGLGTWQLPLPPGNARSSSIIHMHDPAEAARRALELATRAT